MNGITKFEKLEGTRQEEVQFGEWKFFDDRLKVMLPDILKPMTKENIAYYYPKEDRPAILLSDEKADYQCGFQYFPGIKCQWSNLFEISQEVARIVEDSQPMREVSRVYTSFAEKFVMHWFTVNMRIKKRMYEQLEFLLPLQGHLVIGTLLYPEEEKIRWHGIGEEVFQSIQCR